MTETKGISGCAPYGDWIHERDNSVGRILGGLGRPELAVKLESPTLRPCTTTLGPAKL